MEIQKLEDCINENNKIKEYLQERYKDYCLTLNGYGGEIEIIDYKINKDIILLYEIDDYDRTIEHHGLPIEYLDPEYNNEKISSIKKLIKEIEKNILKNSDHEQNIISWEKEKEKLKESNKEKRNFMNSIKEYQPTSENRDEFDMIFKNVEKEYTIQMEEIKNINKQIEDREEEIKIIEEVLEKLETEKDNLTVNFKH